MFDFSRYGFSPARILLPDVRIDPAKWAVVACDQFTSQPDYWQKANTLVGESPSTLRMIYPECYLKDAPANPEAIHESMREYLNGGILSRSFDGFVLVERETASCSRIGLVGKIDLEKYDYHRDAHPLIRPTEGTVLDRLPPRAAIRTGAPLELPHVMLLADDPEKTLIEPIYARRGEMPLLYDFDTMLGGGHLRGWQVSAQDRIDSFGSALSTLYSSCDGFLFAVGDGNHSLAAARLCWERIRETLPESERSGHPARFALVEINNLHDPALVFEPIHRAVFAEQVPLEDFIQDFSLYCRNRGMALSPCGPDTAHLTIDNRPFLIENPVNPLPLAILQPFLDEWIAAHPGCGIDYIHGTDALQSLNAIKIQLNRIDKHTLFDAVRRGGVLPRKSFSIGEANEKRYYFECRRLFD